MNQWGVIYQYPGVYCVSPLPKKSQFPLRQIAGFAFLALGLGGMLGPMIPAIRLETGNALRNWSISNKQKTMAALPAATPVVYEPLLSPDGTEITPVSQDFSIVIPKIGVNADVIPGVDPTNYSDALEAGVAHASTSFLPGEDGTVYLFSHSTNYDWFVKDLNAVFYLVKNLDSGDNVILIYKGKRYTYKITDKRIVSPKSTSYLYPYAGRKNLILQTCWPPGSVSQRLLIFADLIEENGIQI